MSKENQRIPVMVGRPQPQPRAAESRSSHVAEGTAEPQQNFHTPLIDIHEGPDGLVLEADLPGASEEGVVIQLEENVLTLHAHVPSPAPEGARALHEEYRVADFRRSFILSDEVERSRIAAELKNGVLRLTLPKDERAKTRRIEIKS